MKSLVKKIPVVNSIVEFVYFTFVAPLKSFDGSEQYWQNRYRKGGNSGAGSYEKLAQFKAEFLNGFVEEQTITEVIEFGCGDGNQLRSANYSSYMGFDVSADAIAQCQRNFMNDHAKRFLLVDQYNDELAELTLSLDVVYHLVEDSIFSDYMERLFNASSKFVIIYSSNTNEQSNLQAAHVKHRKFSDWIENNKPAWSLKEYVPNQYPHTGNDQEGSFADFYVYEKAELH